MTTNPAFKDWGTIFPNAACVAARRSAAAADQCIASAVPARMAILSQ